MDAVDFIMHGSDHLAQPHVIVGAPEMTLELPPPEAVFGGNLLTPATAAAIHQIRQLSFPAVEYVALQGARMIDRSLVMSAAGDVFPGTLPAHLRADCAARFPPGKTGRSTRGFTGVRTLSGTTLILPVSSPAMSHFLFEGMVYLTKVAADVATVVLTTKPGVLADSPRMLQAFVDITRMALGRDVQVLYRTPDVYDELWSMERALVPIYTFRLHPSMRQSTYAVRSACEGPTADNSGLIYISRQDTKWFRMLLNEDRIETAMRRLGFEILRLATMHERDVISRFASARVIVGPLGAGLYNSLFSRPGTMVVALGAPNYLRSSMDQCAAIRGLRRIYCFGPDFLSYEPEQAGGNNDFVVDEDEVIGAVTMAMERAPTAAAINRRDLGGRS